MAPHWLPRGRARVWSIVAAVPVGIALACLIGLSEYHSEHTGREGSFVTPTIAEPDQVLIAVSIQKVDPVARELALRLVVTPLGALAEQESMGYPARDLVVQSPILSHGELRFPAHQLIGQQDLTMNLDHGDISDYPFDHYRAALALTASSDGKPVPVFVTLADNDPFFDLHAEDLGVHDFSGFEVTVGRTSATLILAWFMMISMWGLALAVLFGALFITTRRQGLIWGALGWMAATMFALAGFRNTAPGAPPFGCLLDYTAFLWAEAVTALSVICVVVRGLHDELARTE